MRLKEIKPGMVIHCNSDDEKKALLEEAERLGYIWINGCIPTDCIMVKSSGLTIHFHEKNEYYAFDHITWSNKASGVTEFTDLILHELTAEEVLQICAEICNESECLVCPLGEEHCFNDKDTDKSGIVAICEKWKSDHEKKEPEIETVDICRIIEIQPDGRKRCVHELDLITDPELPYGTEMITVNDILRKYCMEHDGEFIAVHEVVSRVKK